MAESWDTNMLFDSGQAIMTQFAPFLKNLGPNNAIFSNDVDLIQ